MPNRLANPPAPVPTEPPEPVGKLTARDPMAVPGFWDPRRRPERPDLTRISIIRFLTETDYPPFNFAGPDGAPAGFNVDLARMLCEEMKVPCTVQMRRFDTLIPSLDKQRGRRHHRLARRDAGKCASRSISAIPITARRRASSRARTSTSTTCGRRRWKAARSPWSPAPRTRPSSRRSSPRPSCSPIRHADAARFALKKGEVDLLFGDGISLAFWLNGTDSANCCVFRGGPFLESRYFGEGVGIAVKKGNDLLRQAFNWALFQLWEKGRFTDLWLRYFPISPF